MEKQQKYYEMLKQITNEYWKLLDKTQKDIDTGKVTKEEVDYEYLDGKLEGFKEALSLYEVIFQNNN